MKRQCPRSTEPRLWQWVDLGIMAYTEAQRLQVTLVDARSTGKIKDDLVLAVEHPPVFTLGRRGGRENLIRSNPQWEKRPIPVVQAERGGDITYHGPGQGVLYPILDLHRLRMDVDQYVTALEEVMIQGVKDWGIVASRSKLNRGVWVGLKKLGSIGIAIRRGITFHGLALNVDVDLTPFSWIRPCGLEGIGMTSMAQEISASVPLKQVRDRMRWAMEEVFGVEFETLGCEHLMKAIDPTSFRGL